MGEFLMARFFWFLCSIVILSLNLGSAGAVNSKPSEILALPVPSPAPKAAVSATSAPLIPTTTAINIEMVHVKGGCYQMGNIFPENREDYPADELPVHEVCVDDFNIGKFEVTQGQWKKIMGNNPSEESSCGDNCPVQNVSWIEVQDFIIRLNSSRSGSKYRLPTEAEFEYAQRSGGKNERYSGGNDVDSVAWYYKNALDTSKKEEFHKIHPVGLKSPNGLGAYDMSGNVWEWTNDWYDENYYSHSPRNNPTGPASGTMRAVRGGCASGYIWNMRTSRRDGYEPNYSYRSIGFRLVRNP
jgi:formylglycine-generating enzyme required for sulfatase activity